MALPLMVILTAVSFLMPLVSLSLANMSWGFWHQYFWTRKLVPKLFMTHVLFGIRRTLFRTNLVSRCNPRRVTRLSNRRCGRMKRSYGGEMSAHHYFRDFAYCDSGMIPWLLMAELISTSGKSLGELVADRF